MAQGLFEFSHLRCFVAVAEELSFRRAADRMNMTQPPLSRQIKLLEERINLKLFERNTRQVKLTSAGKSFYDSAVEILPKCEQAVLKARQAERGEVGAISLGFVPSAALNFIPLIAQSLAEEFPNIALTPTEMMGYEVIEALRSGRIDFGLTRMERSRNEIERVRVVNEPFVAAIPKTHRLAGLENLSISDFDGEPYISFTADTGGFLMETMRAMFSACGISPEKKMEVSQTHSVISLVNHGLGFSIVPKSTRIMQMDNIVFREIDLPHQFRSDMYLVTRAGEDSLLNTKVKEVIIKELAIFRDAEVI